MNNLNPQFEGKQFFKAKVGVLMQEYERNKQQELLQKQQLKQNIMFQIMNKRNKLPPTPTNNEKQSEKTSKTVVSDPTTQQLHDDAQPPSYTVNQVQIKPQSGSAANSVPRSAHQKPQYEEQQALKFQEITFNMKKRNKSLEEQLKYKPSPEPEVHNNDEVEESQQFAKSINRIAKYAKRYFPDTFQANEKFENISSQNMRHEPQEQQQAEDQIEYKEQVNMVNPSFLKPDMSDIHSSSLYKKVEESKKYEPESPEQQEEEEEDPVEQNIEEDNRGVFLTMQESESMTASQMPKNVAFQIKMDKPEDADHLEELRRQKIHDMEKKRQERIQQYRKHQAQKKVEHPKPRNSISSSRHEKHDKDLEKQIQIPPKSTTIQRKSNMHRPPKIDNKSERQPIAKNQPIPLEQYDQMKQSKASKNSYLLLHQNDIKQSGFKASIQYEDPPPLPPHKPVSPFKTPKTVMSQQRSKSNNRGSNIFAGQSHSQYHRQKSASRQDPKIEPKDRKNSFTRQSNKKLMINAITYVCFPGELNRKDRQRLVEVLQSSEHEFFIFLFKEYSRKILKGIYVLDNTQIRLQRIYGDKAPPQITADRVQYFYRFDSGSRQFKKVDGCRSFSLAIHAIDLR